MRTRLWVSLACIAGSVALALAIPVNPCPIGSSGLRYQRPFAACIDLPGDPCRWWAPNYGYTWVCDFWCCYDSNGNYIGKLVGDCYGDCNPNGGCCNNLVSCEQARSDYLNNQIICPQPE